MNERLLCLDFLLKQPHAWCSSNEVRENWDFGGDISPEDALRHLVDTGFIEERDEHGVIVYRIIATNIIIRSMMRYELELRECKK